MSRKYKSKRFAQRGRMGKHGVRLFSWQRLQEKVYPSEAVVRGAQTVMMGDLFDALQDLHAWAVDQCVDLELILLEEIDKLEDELEEQTPFDPDGPNDPPEHAAAAWNINLKSRDDASFTISISNPKDYIQFLEERGGRADHPGADAPGWMQDAFDNFRLNLEERVS